MIQVGAVVDDYVRSGDFAGVDEIERSLGIDGQRPVVLFTLHPIPTDMAATTSELGASLTALAELVEHDIQVVATQPNGDHGANQIRAGLSQLSRDLGPNFVLRDSLGRRLFHGLLALGGTPGHRLAVVGNSSAGVKEAGAFNCPCVNVGQRQRGRLRGGSVVDVGADTQAIVSAVRSVLIDDSFRSRILEAGHPYTGRDVGQSVADVLATLPLDTVLLNKKSPHAEWDHQDNS